MRFPSDHPAAPDASADRAVATAIFDGRPPGDGASVGDQAEPGGAAEAPYEAPRTDGEALVASVFAQVLELDRVGVHDDLFRRGGNSLHAVQVISRINDATGLDVPVSLIFEHPTVAELTEALEKLAEASTP
jgi:acyl carrier protein